MATTARGHQRVLVVANEPLPSDVLHRELEKRAHASASTEFRLIAPAVTSSRFKLAAGDVDDAIADALARLTESTDRMEARGLRISGSVVGDSDPVQAIEDALRTFDADELIIVSQKGDGAGWLEPETAERAREQFGLPIVEVTVDSHDASMRSRRLERKRGEPEAQKGPEDHPSYAPPMAPRDAGAIAVGLLGTLALVLLAATCSGDISGSNMSTGCAIRFGLAIGAFIVTVFHVVGLVLFASVDYKGAFEKATAWIILAGFPAAVLLSVLV